MTQAAGIGVLKDEEYTRDCCGVIMKNRAYLTAELEKLGFEHTPSVSNFVFAKHPGYDGERLYLELKKRGVLIRHFTKERIKDYNRITIGSKEQLDVLLCKIREIFKEAGI